MDLYDVFMAWYPFDLSAHVPCLGEQFDFVDGGDEDSFVGLTDPFDCGLAVYIYDTHRECWGAGCATFAANLNTLASAVYTFCFSSGPRYCSSVCEVFGQNAATPTCPAIPDPSM